MKHTNFRKVITFTGAVLIPATFIISLMLMTQPGKDFNNGSVSEPKNVQLFSTGSLKLSPIKEIAPPDIFKNALLAGIPRPNRVNFTFGISCIQRPENKAYIFGTIDSLLNNSTPEQHEQLAIVILLADFSREARRNLSQSLIEKYESYFKSGVIRTIEAPPDFYPDLDHLKQTYKHPMIRVKWRSKQNYDFAFLMLYSQNISTYYLQLEDDVTTVPNYINEMLDFIAKYKSFTCLEFSDLGFIAKLFHNSDLGKLATMLMLFFNEQPNDVTYLHFNELMLQFRRIVRKPTLFQHHGFYSSLSLKRQNIQDLYFTDTKGKKRPLPVVQRSRIGIRGPEAAVIRERQKELKQFQKPEKIKPKIGEKLKVSPKT